ncbi:protein boule isoform X1 [Leguminivora glycinivorella]|uniref:protein boule isoform X1 n=1 Tax=Leguminivora glycinivorella TaxID=1035111 RepID=UPI00200DA303|nr:protein boule isoform X1 [Leguminivora glycinivorella]
MEVKRYIRSESASCAHMVEESAANNRKSVDPHEKLKALLNSPEDDTDDSLPPSDAPKFGTVIHNRIFVGGFSLTTTDEDLWKFFSGFATVTAARVIYDRAGVSKCYGFVTFASPRVARLIVKQSGGVMFSPLGRLRVAQAVRKQMSQLPVLGSEAAPLPAPLCYQLLCAPPLAPLPACAPCELPPPPYAMYPLPFDSTYIIDRQATPALYAPPTQYALVPAPYSTCCEPSCCAPLDKQPRIPPPPLHPAYIY